MYSLRPPVMTRSGRYPKLFPTSPFVDIEAVAVRPERSATHSFLGPFRSKLGAGVGGAGVGCVGAGCGISIATGTGIA